MIYVELKAQNLRNKYEHHPVIEPIIVYCNQNKISFEFLKEIVHFPYGIKSFNTTNVYYMKIGNNLLISRNKVCGWNSLLELITFAYEHLGIQKPDRLTQVLNSFKNREQQANI
ncbi:MAG: hypothetical protein GX568_10840 [Candidatus Gastranaerophilales bacterium]|nr:hypothetical protein [Candidatus Gastranaerophilales bacterium]